MTAADDRARSKAELNKRMHKLWQKFRPVMLKRLEPIAHAVGALHDGPLPEKLRAQAVHEAHKLAGSLGTFGLEAGSEAALQIERLLSENEVPCPIADITGHFNQLRQEIEGK